MKSALMEFVRCTLRPYCGWRLSWRPGNMTISKLYSPPLKHALLGMTKSQQKPHAEKWSKDGLYKCCQGIKEKWSKHPQGFREGFPEVVAHEKKAAICQIDKVGTRLPEKARVWGKELRQTPVVWMDISLRLLGMWTRTGSWEWRRAPRSVGGAQLTLPSLWRAIRVAQGWGQEEGCPTLLCCRASSPVPWRAAPGEREWAEQVPATPALWLILGPWSPCLCRETWSRYGKFLGSQAWTRPGPPPPSLLHTKLGQAAAEPCWGSGMPSDREVRVLSIEAH